MTKILIADDHPVLRNGIVYIVKTKLIYPVLLEAENGKSALDLILKEKPDLAILDVDMPLMKGLEVARRVIKAGVKTKLVILTMHNDKDVFNEAMNIGVNGFLLKDNAIAEIVLCIESVLKGTDFVSPAIQNLLNKRLKQTTGLMEIHDAIKSLTSTEYKILQLISKGKTSAEIAKFNFISIRTVDNHRASICKKLGIKGNNALLMFVTTNHQLLSK